MFLSDPFTLIWGVWQGVHSHTVMAEVPAIFIDADTRVTGIQIGDHEIK